MKKIVTTLFIATLIFSLSPLKTLAAFDKINGPNNKFGIHLAVASQEDLQDAAFLVNSSGGDWGWVTLVIEEKDRSKEKWQGVFDQMRKLHLIPIVRLATLVENGGWRRSEPQEAKAWAQFLNSLNWVVKNRYVVLFNEPNHAKEWGGQVDPESYAQVAFEFAKALKEANSDFFVMLAGMDAAAPNQPPFYSDEEVFLKRMFSSVGPEKLSQYLDALASHSYPNHGFVGLSHGVGRNSIRTYLWELNLLKRLGVGKELPVFITETGWPHAEGINTKPNFYTAATAAQNFNLYFDQLIRDPQVVAITPFVLNYQGEPFDHFSWRTLGEPKEFYPQYELVQGISKVKGEPEQEQKLEITKKLPEKFTKNSTYQIPIKVRNEGQAIWSKQDGYQLKLLGDSDKIKYFVSDFSQVMPFKEEEVRLFFKTGDQVEKLEVSIAVAKDGKVVSNPVAWSLKIVPMININLTVGLFQKRESVGKDFKFLVYNPQEEVVFEMPALEVSQGKGRIENVNNLVIGEKYRLVILKPYYLPRQTFAYVKENENAVVFEKMLPLDFNLDGRLSWEDGLVLIKNPRLLKLWWIN